VSGRISTSTISITAVPERVWEALTRPELVKQWQYNSDLITDWKPGSPIRFRSEFEGTVYEQWGTVLQVEPFERLSYTLFAPRPGLEDEPGNRFAMTYLLDPAGDSTRLSIVQEDPREQTPGEAEDEEGNPMLDALKALVEGR